MEIFDCVSKNDIFILSAVDHWDGERKVLVSSQNPDNLRSAVRYAKNSFEYNNYYAYSIFKIEKNTQKKKP